MAMVTIGEVLRAHLQSVSLLWHCASGAYTLKAVPMLICNGHRDNPPPDLRHHLSSFLVLTLCDGCVKQLSTH